jgi:hypothetical protein
VRRSDPPPSPCAVIPGATQLAGLRAQAAHELSKVDVLIVPTALAHYTVQVRTCWSRLRRCREPGQHYSWRATC